VSWTGCQVSLTLPLCPGTVRLTFRSQQHTQQSYGTREIIESPSDFTLYRLNANTTLCYITDNIHVHIPFFPHTNSLRNTSVQFPEPEKIWLLVKGRDLRLDTSYSTLVNLHTLAKPEH